FAQDGDGNCAFKKASANNPLQIYFDIDIAVTQINALYVASSYVYLAFNDATYIGARYSLTNPLSTSTDFNLPGGITEAPVDVLANGSDLFYLIPGNTSGLNAKIVKMSTSGVYDQTIDLSTITNAVSFTMDDNGDIWVVTDTSPAQYIRVYEQSGGVWTYTAHT
ncbi:MAG: hypothetical protein PVG65_00230, partial [Candidatus Thorarchaeota archaeon]